MKVCGTCKEEKPKDRFGKDNNSLDGLFYRCRDCRSVYFKGRGFWAYTKRKYGITKKDYNVLYKEQGGKCKICERCFKPKKEYKAKQVFIDHSHKTGKVRGLLCNDCNSSIGKFQDNIITLANAIKYLAIELYEDK